MDSRALPAIPPSLTPFADKIRSTVKDALNLKLQPTKDLLPWQSKVGGTPYLPMSAEYPRSTAGVALKLLAQVNFSEAPNLYGFPEKGILQFFIDPTDEFLGMGSDFDHIGQNLFRVKYFEDVEEDASKLKTEELFHIDGGKVVDIVSKKESPLYWPLDADCQLSMEFEPFQQYMTVNDDRVGTDIFGCDPNLPCHEQYAACAELFDDYEEHFKSKGHQIGGYPFFTQHDPRCTNQDLRGYELLLQLDSEFFESNNIGICWGDMGVGGFFIRPEDLEKRDFSRVMYNWDCC